MTDREGLLDTSTLLLLPRITDVSVLPEIPLISVITLAEPDLFFSGGTETDAGESMSWQAVQAKLKEIIDAEDKSNPLSDDELVVKLKNAGIEIARRTVAKYRKQMNIAPARQRKEY